MAGYRSAGVLSCLGGMKDAGKKPRELTSSWPDAPSVDVVGESFSGLKSQLC